MDVLIRIQVIFKYCGEWVLKGYENDQYKTHTCKISYAK